MSRCSIVKELPENVKRISEQSVVSRIIDTGDDITYLDVRYVYLRLDTEPSPGTSDFQALHTYLNESFRNNIVDSVNTPDSVRAPWLTISTDAHIQFLPLDPTLVKFEEYEYTSDLPGDPFSDYHPIFNNVGYSSSYITVVICGPAVDLTYGAAIIGSSRLVCVREVLTSSFQFSTFTHEMGHCLGLKHTWDETAVSGSICTRRIPDLPEQLQSGSSYNLFDNVDSDRDQSGCPVYKKDYGEIITISDAICATYVRANDPNYQYEMGSNFMNYSSIRTMFTAYQSRSMISKIMSRSNLYQIRYPNDVSYSERITAGTTNYYDKDSSDYNAISGLVPELADIPETTYITTKTVDKITSKEFVDNAWFRSVMIIIVFIIISIVGVLFRMGRLPGFKSKIDRYPTKHTTNKTLL